MKNNYETIGEVTKIYFRNCNEFMLIDTEDFERVSKHTWYKDCHGYGRGYVNGKHKRCHNFIVGKAPDGLVTDHINRNKLDNRKSNLRFCTPLVNTHNRVIPSKTGYQGIRHRVGKRVERYSAEFKDQFGRTVYIGSYKSLESAIENRNKALELYEKGELTPFQIKKLRKAQ